MHDLEFVPSDSVWTGIQQGMAPRERRRAVAVLWWLFPGLMLIGGGVMMYRHSASTDRVAKAVPARGAHAGSGEAATSAGAAATPEGAAADGRGRATSTTANGGKGVGPVVTNGETSSREAMTDGSTVREPGQEVPGNFVNASGGAESVAARRARGSWFQPGLVREMFVRRGIVGPMLNVPVNTAVEGIRQPRHPWRVGFVAGGGGSMIYARGGNALVAGGPSNSYAASPGVYPSTNYGIPQMRPTFSSAGSPGSERSGSSTGINYSYWAGIYGERQLSARWAVDIGLNLHYYSVRFQTETYSNVYAPTSASLLVASSYTYALNTAGAYNSGLEQTYVNNYYFLEMPVTAQLRINRSRVMPVFWRGGAVLSYLISSNGLYFDNPTGVFKSDNGTLRRAQVSVQSGLAVGLPIRGVQIQAGPEIQYALTPMLKPSPGGGNMLYSGVRVALTR